MVSTSDRSYEEGCLKEAAREDGGAKDSHRYNMW